MRFLEDLQKGDDPWIKDRRHQLGHFVGHFIICKYETSNPTRDTLWDTKRDKLNKGIINKGKEIKDSRLPFENGKSVSHKILFFIFQEENQKLPRVEELTEDLLGKCRSRINQARRKGCLEHYLSDFRSAVKKAQQTPFLCGEGDNGWKASFDWFVANHRNAYKILEGNYDNLPRKGKNSDLYVGASKNYNKHTEDPPAWSLERWVIWARANGIDSALSLMKAWGVDSFGIRTLETEIQKAVESDKVVNL
ncbi:MAG: hypothetical protein JXR49_19535 [Acidobacteria bacterium]|nr:hypothetical protein [Acidobacteriota bacterium]